MSQKNNEGVLFPNDKKESDNHPDFKGNATIDGVEYWLSSWKNKSKDGKPYMSIKLSAKTEAAPKPSQYPKHDSDPFA
jgi:uncharacterized protein (DUF736 family)